MIKAGLLIKKSSKHAKKGTELIIRKQKFKQSLKNPKTSATYMETKSINNRNYSIHDFGGGGTVF